MPFIHKFDGQLLRETETPQPFMEPTHESSLESLPSEKMPHLLQNRVHYALAGYLNDPERSTGTALQRVVDRLDVTLPQADVRKRLLSSYEWLDVNLPDGHRDRRISVDRFEHAQYDTNELEREIGRIANRLAEIDEWLTTAILHGSFGDLDYVKNYSDVDLLVVVNWESLADQIAVERIQETIKTIQRQMHYIDPHQHHGVMVVTDLDLRAYNRAYLPPEALTEGTVLCGEDSLTFSFREDELERRYGLWRNVQRLRQTVANDRFPIDFYGSGNLQSDLSGHLYSLKYFTSFVMLQPSMYLLADGRPMYKGESFDSLPPLGEHGTILEQCSEIRRLYPDYVEFDRDGTYEQRLREDPQTARADQQSTIPPVFREILDGSPFARALEFTEHLWTDLA